MRPGIGVSRQQLPDLIAPTHLDPSAFSREQSSVIPTLESTQDLPHGVHLVPNSPGSMGS